MTSVTGHSHIRREAGTTPEKDLWQLVTVRVLAEAGHSWDSSGGARHGKKPKDSRHVYTCLVIELAASMEGLDLGWEKEVIYQMTPASQHWCYHPLRPGRRTDFEKISTIYYSTDISTYDETGPSYPHAVCSNG